MRGRSAQWNHRTCTYLVLVVIAGMSIGTAESPTVFGCDDDDPCDSSSWDDSDGDGMSDATEQNPTNLYLNLDPKHHDDNPTVAHGSTGNYQIETGSLEKGLNLKNYSGACGYVHYPGTDPPESDDWGTAALLAIIEDVSREWAQQHRAQKMQPGDMSLQGGGPFFKWNPACNCRYTDQFDHKGHQKGTEVDVRYVRVQDQLGELNLNTDIAHCDLARTQQLITMFRNKPAVIKIYVSSQTQMAQDGVIEWDADHYDHFHVRIQDPDGEGN